MDRAKSGKQKVPIGAFMEGLVDYAGLFPPASLSVVKAVSEYAQHRNEPEAWMLGRFIAPAARLTEIATAVAPLLEPATNWAFSVLVGARDSGGAALAAVPVQAAQIRGFEAGNPGQVVVECLEGPVPVAAEMPVAEFVPVFLAELCDAGLGKRDLFLEVLSGSDDGEVLQSIKSAATAFTGGPTGFVRVGAKLRCGGVVPEAFPSCERIAKVIQCCAELDLPLKCTAGLHHPVRHRTTFPDVMMHGFLNVFGAGLLAWSREIDPALLVECVAETDPAAFVFNQETFAWRDHSVDIETMTRIRRRSLFGFGSCSFAEPRADLQALGML